MNKYWLINFTNLNVTEKGVRYIKEPVLFKIDETPKIEDSPFIVKSSF